MTAKEYYINDLRMAGIPEEEIQESLEFYEEEMPMIFSFAENYAMHKVAEHVKTLNKK